MSESCWVTVLALLLVGDLANVGWSIVSGNPADAVFAWFGAGVVFYGLRAHVRGKSFVQRER